MRITLRRLASLGLVVMALNGCANAVSISAISGAYAVMVSAFGKTDPDVCVVGPGSDGAVLFDFTYGFTTDYGAPNATGLRAHVDGQKLVLDMQPVHVDHSTGQIDGMLTGVGSTGDTNLALTLKVLPSNIILRDENGQPLPPGSTIDYEVNGPRQ
jgi:hypothetical protein